MAKTFSASVLTKSTAVRVLGVFSLLLLIQKGNAFEFKVGGSNGWSVPKDPNAYGLNQWAEKNRFQIGDTLLFEYPSSSDSVLQVTKDDYTNCNTENPVVKYSDGHTVFKFNQSGPYYFISGVKDNCVKYEKLHVVVLADRSNKTTSSPPPSPPPSVTPAPAPSSEINPTPEPAADNNNHPRGSAASSVVNIVGSIGALLGSSLVFVL